MGCRFVGSIDDRIGTSGDRTEIKKDFHIREIDTDGFSPEQPVSCIPALAEPEESPFASTEKPQASPTLVTSESGKAGLKLSSPTFWCFVLSVKYKCYCVYSDCLVSPHPGPGWTTLDSSIY
jgi:hypothetical protein